MGGLFCSLVCEEVSSPVWGAIVGWSIDRDGRNSVSKRCVIFCANYLVFREGESLDVRVQSRRICTGFHVFRRCTISVIRALSRGIASSIRERVCDTRSNERGEFIGQVCLACTVKAGNRLACRLNSSRRIKYVSYRTSEIKDRNRCWWRPTTIE